MMHIDGWPQFAAHVQEPMHQQQASCPARMQGQQQPPLGGGSAVRSARLTPPSWLPWTVGSVERARRASTLSSATQQWCRSCSRGCRDQRTRPCCGAPAYPYITTLLYQGVCLATYTYVRTCVHVYFMCDTASTRSPSFMLETSNKLLELILNKMALSCTFTITMCSMKYVSVAVHLHLICHPLQSTLLQWSLGG